MLSYPQNVKLPRLSILNYILPCSHSNYLGTGNYRYYKSCIVVDEFYSLLICWLGLTLNYIRFWLTSNKSFSEGTTVPYYNMLGILKKLMLVRVYAANWNWIDIESIIFENPIIRVVPIPPWVVALKRLLDARPTLFKAIQYSLVVTKRCHTHHFIDCRSCWSNFNILSSKFAWY